MSAAASRAPRRCGALPAALAPTLALALTLAACSGDEPQAEDPGALLAAAKATLDASSSVAVRVTSADLPAGSSALVGAQGTAARPASFEGELDVAIGGGTVSVGVVSVDDTVYVKTPFASEYAVTDPADFGLRDPALLIDPDTGISSMLTEATQVALGDESRVEGEVVREVTAQIPGAVIERLLTSADPAQPMSAAFSVVEGSSELRRAVLTGPFLDAQVDSTYTIDLDQYGEEVEIRAPAGAPSAAPAPSEG